MESPGIGRESFQVVLDTEWHKNTSDILSSADRYSKFCLDRGISHIYKIRKIKGHRRLIHVGYSHTVKILE